MGKSYRAGRLGEEIRRIISHSLLTEVNDPQLSHMVSITGVKVSPDGSYATVYVVSSPEESTPDENQEREEQVIVAMERAKGLFKREIGSQLKLRHIPELRFKTDTSLAYGRHMEALIQQVVKDEE